MKDVIALVLALAGVVLIVIAAALIYVPLAFLLSGLALFYLARFLVSPNALQGGD